MVLLETSRKEAIKQKLGSRGRKGSDRGKKIGRFESKNLFTIFFRTSGVLHISYLDKGKTIDHQTYIKCLKHLVSTLKEQRPMYGTKNLKFHHDNARPHVHKDVKKYLESQNLTVMSQPYLTRQTLLLVIFGLIVISSNV